MKRISMIWLAAGMLLACAAALTAWRFMMPRTEQRLPLPETAVQDAVRLIDADTGLARRETQTAVRTAAVLVEHGLDSSAEGCYVLATQYQREENLSMAEALYKRAIALRPEWSRPYCSLGNLLGRHCIERHEEAKEVLYKAIQLEPRWARPHNVLAVLLRLEKNLEEAEKEALIALDLAPDDIAAHNNYANLLMAQNKYEEAATHYQKAIELNPENAKPYYNLACLYSLQDRRKDAMKYLRDALQRAPALRADAANDPDLKGLRKNAEFRRLVYGEPENPSETEETGPR